MATVIEEIAIALDLDPKQLTAGIKKAAGQVDAGTKKMASRFESLKKSVFNLRNAVAGIAGAYVFREFSAAAKEATSATLGLRAVAEFKGIEGADEAIQDLEAVRSGMLALSDAQVALKNLLARDYTLEQAVEMLNRLADAAAYGRQGQLSLGEAVKSAAEGLKNENSILVDNAGVTKNVSVMWAEYAKQIGVGVRQLTQEQKIQAEYQGILRETQAQVGNLAELSETAAGAEARMAAEALEAKVNLGALVNEALMPLLNIGTSVLSFFNDMNTSTRSGAVALAGIAVLIYKAVIPALKALGVTLNMGLGWFGLILTAVTALVAAFATDFMSIRGYTAAALKGAWAFIRSFWDMTKAFARNVGDIFRSLGKIIMGAMNRSWSEMKVGAVGLKAAMQSAVKDVNEVWKKAGDEAALAWLEAKKKRLEKEREKPVAKPRVPGMPEIPMAVATGDKEQELQDRLMALRFKTNKISLKDYVTYLQKKIDAIRGTSTKEILVREELEAKIRGLNEQAEKDEQSRMDAIYKYRVKAGRLTLDDQIVHLQTELALAEDGTLRKLQLEDELAQKKQALWEQTYAAEIAMQEQALSVMMAGYDTFWQTITDRAMTGKQRLEAMWDAMKRQFISTIAAELKAFIFGEQVKQAESKKTTIVLIGEYIAQAAKAIWAAGASIVNAIASGFKWLVSTLGPFGLAAGIALGAGIIAAFMGFKSAMGFASGGYTGEGGKEEPAGIVHKGEYVVPQWVVKKYPEMVQTIETIRERGYQVGGMVREVIRPEKVIETIETIRERELIPALERVRTDAVSTLMRTPSLPRPAPAGAGGAAGALGARPIEQHLSFAFYGARKEDMPEIKRYVRDEIVPELRRLEERGVETR